MANFKDTISALKLQDLGFKGHTFTWSNGRTEAANIQVRLDRGLVNLGWQNMFPSTVLTHLPRLQSDYAPLLVECVDDPQNRVKSLKKKLFRFEKMWMKKDSCRTIVEKEWGNRNNLLSFADWIQRCSEHLSHWDRTVVGNLEKRIKIIRANIEALQCQHQVELVIHDLRLKQNEPDDLLKQEKIWWF